MANQSSTRSIQGHTYRPVLVAYPPTVRIDKATRSDRSWMVLAVMAIVVPVAILVGTVFLVDHPEIGRPSGPRIDQSWVSPSPQIPVGR